MVKSLTPNRRSVFVGFGVVAVVILIFGLMNLDFESESNPEDVQIEEESDTQSQFASNPSSMGQADQPSPAKSHDLWKPANMQLAGTLPMQFGQPPSDAVLMEIKDNPTNWVVGTQVSFFIPMKKQTFVVEVEDIQVSATDNKTYSGSGTSVDGQTLRLIATTGKKDTLVYLSVGGESFELSAFDGVGYLIPSSSLGAHIDYTKTDVRHDPKDKYRNVRVLPK